MPFADARQWPSESEEGQRVEELVGRLSGWITAGLRRTYGAAGLDQFIPLFPGQLVEIQ